MSRVDGWGKAMQQWMLVTAVSALVVGCGGSGDKGDSTKAQGGADVHGDIVREAEANYKYGAERPPVPVDTAIINGPGGVLPTITISTATQNSASGRVPGNKFIYQLTSSGAYPAMGLAPGKNYVWRDTSSGPEGPYRTLVVPKDTTYPMVWLRRDTSVASYAPLPAVEPRLVKSMKGYGGCDNNCVPHCASREFLRTFTVSDTLRIQYKP